VVAVHHSVKVVNNREEFLEVRELLLSEPERRALGFHRLELVQRLDLKRNHLSEQQPLFQGPQLGEPECSEVLEPHQHHLVGDC